MIETAPTPHPTDRWTGERRMLAALHHEQPDRTPVWFMRQAGRCLADYRRLRERYPILTLAKTPELCAEVTVMPVDAFGVDAAVMFADIMLPLEPMGVSLEIQPEVGPIIHAPIRSRADVDRLRPIEPETEVGFVMDAIRLVRRELDGRTAVIGFSGSPFTLACYLVEGRPSRDYANAKAFMFSEPEAWHALMDKLATVVIRYLNAQVAAGVHVVQLFDSWVGALSPADYVAYVQPHVRRIFSEVRGAPTIHFGTGAAALLEAMADAGGDLIGVDHRVPLDAAWERVGYDRGIQGNLDATRVLAGREPMTEGARDVLRRAAQRPGHVFNLGHGVLPDSDPGLLRGLVDLVHADSAR
ncbi:MAG TPA: uroporphyrinogen decarboxylase [Candidatus Limnocylindria bacterium]|nr:uroporphyrinogen decarboxylase [Candidatus Limnocylindria bacterium]